MTRINANSSVSVDRAKAAPSVSGAPLSKGDGLDFLRKQNPGLDTLIKQIPGLGDYLKDQVSKGVVSQGPAPDEVPTPIHWSGWNHSEETGKRKYSHGMKDEQILKKDVIVVYQMDSKSPAIDGMRGNRGQIIGVYNLGQLGVTRCGYDGGWYFNMNPTAHGKKGEEQSVAFSIVGVMANGRIGGGGHPHRIAANDPAFNGCGEWGGRHWKIVHGTTFHTRMVE